MNAGLHTRSADGRRQVMRREVLTFCAPAAVVTVEHHRHLSVSLFPKLI